MRSRVRNPALLPAAQQGLFQELLAADTLKVAESDATAPRPESELAPQGTGRCGWWARAWRARVCWCWLIAARPGFIGYGAPLLWTGPHKDVPLIYCINVKPGDAAVRRNSDDKLVTAQVVSRNKQGEPLRAVWHGREVGGCGDAAGGRIARASSSWFAGLPENVEYYVQAGAAESKHFKLRCVVDSPSVKHDGGDVSLSGVDGPAGGQRGAGGVTCARLRGRMRR